METINPRTANIATLAKALTDNEGEIVWIGPDGYRLTVETDDSSAIEQINDSDCWGRVAWARVDRDAGRQVRPYGFTGAAVKLHPQGWHIDSPVWWEPYRSVDKVHNSKADRETVTRLLSDGFKYVKVEHVRMCEFDCVHVVDFDSLGGVDEMYDGLVEELLGSLVEEEYADTLV